MRYFTAGETKGNRLILKITCLSHDLKEGESASSSTFTRLVVYRPRDDQHDDAEEAYRGRVDSGVADHGAKVCGSCKRQDQVARRRQQGMSGDEWESRLRAV